MMEGGYIQEGLGDNDGEVPLEVENPIFRPVWKDNAGGYLRGVEGGVCQPQKNVRDNVKES